MAEILARTFQRSAPASAWEAMNSILGKGEIGYDETNNQARIGDGVKHWLQLPPIGVTVGQIETIVDSYLAANPPVGSGGGSNVTIVDHPSIPGAGILSFTSSVAPATSLRITQAPQATAVHVGDSATLTAAASDSNATAQWQISTDSGSTWANIDGATAWSYSPSTSAAVGDSSGTVQYRVTFTASGRTVTSLGAAYSVWPNFSFTEQPASQTINSTTSVTFRATGTTGQGWGRTWERSVDGGATWSLITGVTGFLTFAADSTMNGYRYRAVMVHSVTGRRVVSTAATLTYVAGTAPVISYPTTSEVMYTDRYPVVSLESDGTGSPTPSVQWQRRRSGGSWTDITGATSKVSQVDPAVEFPGGYSSTVSVDYRVIYTNAVGTATSATITYYNEYSS